jgi:hypothetical protein
VKLGQDELIGNEHAVMTNRFLSQIGHFCAQINSNEPRLLETKTAGFGIIELDMTIEFLTI